MSEQVEVGAWVQASYKTGTYVGKLIEKRDWKAVVEVHAVLVHPEQGDLHNPLQTEGVLFHTRKALAFTEKALMPMSDLKPYHGQVPDYRVSLLKAYHAEQARMNQLAKWANRASMALSELAQDYGINE